MKHNLPTDPHAQGAPPGEGDPAKPVGPQVLLVKDGDNTWVVPLGTDTQGIPAQVVPSKDQATQLGSDFAVTLFDGQGYTPPLRNTTHGIVSFWVVRLGTNPDRTLLRAPNHADDLLMPAVLAILKH